MKQIVQDIKNGETMLEEVPTPKVKPGHILIKTSRSLVSQGTERMFVEFGKANFINKAMQQPDQVNEIFKKMKSEGIMPTISAVFNKLDKPLPLGYCNAGVVESVSKNVHEFKVGDRVVSNGYHAEYVCVPENLAAIIPDKVTDEDATFTVIGSIGLHGIRLLKPTFGETVVVIGLGLVGLITAELLKANGCRVIGYDFNQKKVDLANSKGIITFNPTQGINPVKYINQITNEIGADGVIITAANKSNEVIRQATEMSRQRGRIVLVGDVGLGIERDAFFRKELTFQVSRSYGPGRYDENYEQKGHDYPIGYVRWTEKRNFEAVLQAIELKRLDVNPLITERVPITNYKQIYGDMRKEGIISSILIYSSDSNKTNSISITPSNFKGKKGVFGIIGAGHFTSSTIIPAMISTNAKMKYIASAGGLSATTLAKKGHIANATSDYKEILKDDEVDTIIIATRHNIHARLTVEALNAGKNVFVEKPLCLNEEEIENIIKAVDNSKMLVVVGFNRRFAPLAQKMKQILGDGPKNIVATMNAGHIPPEMWVHDLEVGGGRIIGEACHYVDLCIFLAGSKIKSVCMNSMGPNSKDNTDNASIMLKFENGTNAVLNYFSNGSKSYSKERIEAYSQEKTLIIDNWRSLTGYGTKGFNKARSRLDKGHKNQFRMLVESTITGTPIIPFNEIVNTFRSTFGAIESLIHGQWIDIE